MLESRGPVGHRIYPPCSPREKVGSLSLGGSCRGWHYGIDGVAAIMSVGNEAWVWLGPHTAV